MVLTIEAHGLRVISLPYNVLVAATLKSLFTKHTETRVCLSRNANTPSRTSYGIPNEVILSAVGWCESGGLT